MQSQLNSYYSAELLRIARERFGEKAEIWLNSPNLLLALRTPLQAILEFSPDEVVRALSSEPNNLSRSELIIKEPSN